MEDGLIHKTVDGFDYAFSMMGARQSTKLFIRLTKICGKPFALAFTALGKKSTPEASFLDRPIDTFVLADAVEALCSHMDEDIVLDMIQSLTSDPTVLCDGKKVVFDVHYKGRTSHLMKVLFAALEVQYGNFFDAFIAPHVAAHPPGMTPAPIM